MKKTSILKALIIVSALTGFTPSFGQYAKNSAMLNPSKLMEVSRVIISSEESDRKALESIKAISLKMHKDFTKFNKNVSDIRTSHSNKHTFIYFNQSGIKCRAAYNQKGRWVNTVRFMNLNQIPGTVRKTVANAYPCYQVLRAVEVNVGPHTALIVDLENEQSFKKIRIINDEMDVYQELNKQ